MKKLYKVTYYNLEKNDYELTTVSASRKRYAREIAEDIANKEQLVESERLEFLYIISRSKKC